MSTFIKSLVAKKLQQISYEDLLYYSKEYGFSLNENEAKEITNYVKSQPMDPFNKHDRMEMFQELAKITNKDTANKAQDLFDELIKSYGLEHLFE